MIKDLKNLLIGIWGLILYFKPALIRLPVFIFLIPFWFMKNVIYGILGIPDQKHTDPIPELSGHKINTPRHKITRNVL